MFCNKASSALDLTGIKRKYFDVLIHQLNGFSYSDIQNLVQNVVKQKIIKNESTASVFDFLHEVVVFKHHGNIEQKSVIRYLLDCGLPQQAIADYFNISVRQVRNCLQKKD